MKVIEYTPKGVCSRKFTITIDDDKIVSIKIEGGCNGNLQGISKLLEGMKVEDVIAKLDGISCRGSRIGSSCPDQIAQALKEALQENL